MRLTITMGMVCVFVCLVLSGGAHAVGDYVVGKEKCDSTSLNAKGIVPDTMNKFKELFVFTSYMAKAIDTLAGEVKAILGQFGIQTRPHISKEQLSYQNQSKIRKLKR